MFSVFITHHSKIRELNDGNKNQTDFSAMGPTYFELWVMEIELWTMETQNQTVSILLNIQVIHHHYCCSFLISFFLLFVFQVLFFWVCSLCSRCMWIEREINTTFWYGFSCIFGLFFVLGGERHKIWAKIPIYPWF